MTFAGDTLLAALDEMADRLPGRSVTQVAESMSRRYRARDRDDRGAAPHVTAEEVVAYAVSRMPATYAAARSALQALSATRPFQPRTVLDLGGGLGAAAYAAAATWATVEAVTVADAEPLMLATGRTLRLAVGAGAPAVSWQRRDLASQTSELAQADLVTIGYVLSELPAHARRRVVEQAGAASRIAVVIIEPGTPNGYERVLDAREVLVAAGFDIAAPCPHARPCALSGTDDWCHFAVRLPRSRAHRVAKGGQLGYEDEKFSYVAATRDPVSGERLARIIRHPTWRKSLVELRLCQPGDPAVDNLRIPRSAGEQYRAARDATWGGTWPQT